MTELPLDPGYALGLTVCRLALDPRTGRIRHGSRVGIAVRGALFVELALAGRVQGGRQPRAIGISELTGEPADFLHRAVAGRAPTHYKRWFSHTRADVDAALEAMQRHRMLEPDGNGGWRDTDQGLVNAQIDRVEQVLELGRATRSPKAREIALGAVPTEDAVVALLAAAAGIRGGRPRPRRALSRMKVLLTGPGAPPRAELPTVQAALTFTLRAVRGQAGSRLFSG